ncbi:MAG: CPXCG motif-containing cysteine-rich protein [Opitutales bacterium]
MHLHAGVVCPFCFQPFFVPMPAPDECPADLDYDCEICCRPMIIHADFDRITNEPTAHASSPDGERE